MTFTVGDLVRGNRDYFIALSKGEVDECEFAENGFKVLHSDGGVCYYGTECGDYLPDRFLEAATRSDFEYGEVIEVRDTLDGDWNKFIFLCKIPGKVNKAFVCSYFEEYQDFKSGKEVCYTHRKYARKIKHKITRSEVAEKLGFPKDFTFIED